MSKPHHPHDSAAKDTLAWALGPFGHVQTQHEIDAPTQYADIWFVPHPQPKPPPAPNPYLQLLRKMSTGLSIFEAFRNTISVVECASVLRKAESLRHERRRNAMDPTLHTWILSPGEPRKALAQICAKPDNAWGPGFFALPEMHDGHIVVASQLTQTPETLILRLLGNHSTQRAAFEELRDLQDVGIRNPLWEIFLRWRIIEEEVPEEARDDAGKDFIMNTQIIYDAAKAKWIAEGRQEGHLSGLSEGIDKGQLIAARKNALAIYKARFGKEVSTDIGKRIFDLGLGELEVLIPRIATLSQDEVHAELGLEVTPVQEG